MRMGFFIKSKKIFEYLNLFIDAIGVLLIDYAGILVLKRDQFKV